MGVCMGKDSSSNITSSDLLSPEGRFIPSNPNGLNSAPLNSSSMNSSHPPVLFVLGGPGSGKITHCDRLCQERPGLAHINMTDLIQQHVVGNGLKEFGDIPPANLVEVLQMEVKMAVNAKAYLVSGYPRGMRDVVEWTSGPQGKRVDAVILLNWHIRILEKQIEYGSQLGDTVLQLASRVGQNTLVRPQINALTYSIPTFCQLHLVAEYFDQLGKLVVVDGERAPAEVYDDFLAAVDKILATTTKGGNNKAPPRGRDLPPDKVIPNGVHNLKNKPSAVSSQTNHNQAFIFTIGGPGSNKSLLASTAVRLHHSANWAFLSIGEELRRNATDYFSQGEARKLTEQMGRGELVADDDVLHLINTFVGRVGRKRGVLIDGFPRTLKQLELFGRKAPTLLVDCSEVELGRSLGRRVGGRADDGNAGAVRRRLEVYREVTLPTLKVLDDEGKLWIIDGDQEDKSRIVQEFNETLGALIDGEGEERAGRGRSKEKRKPSTDTISKMYKEVVGSE